MADFPRRTLLRGSALSALSLTTSGAAVPRAAQARDMPGATMPVVATRAALAAQRGAHPGDLFYLAERGREGVFRCVADIDGVVADPLQGLAVASERAGWRFERVWDGTHGRPEWFGARANDGTVDCAAAIEACFALCPVTELAAVDYFLQRTLRLAQSGRTLRGVGAFAEQTGAGTRIVLHRSAPGIHTDDVLLVGSRDRVAVPGAHAAADCHLSFFTLVRDGACTPHPSGDLALYPAGLRAAFVFHCTFSAIASLESSVGFYIGGVVYTKFDDCYALRVRPGTSAAKDYCVGYYLNGHVSFGYAGGNASLYMNRCLVSDQHPQHVDPVGLLARGAFVDTFLESFESARIATGLAFHADGALGIGNTVDLHVRAPILDGCTAIGIDVDLGGTVSASIDISDVYLYAAAAGGRRGIAVHDGAGQVTLTGGQVHGDFAEGSLSVAHVRGVKVQGVKVHQASRPVVAEQAGALLLEPQINNATMKAPAFAITCRGVSRSIVRPIVIGAGGASFAGGVDLDAACDHCQIDASAVDPGCFARVDAADKVHFAGADARGGASGAAFAAAGNVLTGVTG